MGDHQKNPPPSPFHPFNPLIPSSDPTPAVSAVGRHMSSYLICYILELSSSALYCNFMITINTESLHSTSYYVKYLHTPYHRQSTQPLFGKESEGHRCKQLPQSQITMTGDAGTDTVSSASVA